MVYLNAEIRALRFRRRLIGIFGVDSRPFRGRPIGPSFSSSAGNVVKNTGYQAVFLTVLPTRYE